MCQGSGLRRAIFGAPAVTSRTRGKVERGTGTLPGPSPTPPDLRMLPVRMTPVPGTAPVRDPAANAAPPVIPLIRVPGQAPVGLSALPAGLRDEVTHRLPPRDVVQLAATCKEARENYAEAVTAAARAQEAAGANLEILGRLLNGPDGIAKLPPLLQAEPWRAAARRLGDLAKQVADHPQPARTARFDSLIQMAGRLPKTERGAPLTRLAFAVQYLPEPDRHPRFAALLAPTGPLPDANRQPVEDQLAQTLHTLPTGDRARGFAQVLLAAGNRPAEHRLTVIQKLRHQLRRLPASDRLAAFVSLVNASLALGAQGAWQATHLAPYIADLPEGARYEAFSALTHRLGWMGDDDEHRSTAALLLSGRIQHLPSASHEAAARQIAAVLRPLNAPLCHWLMPALVAAVPATARNAMRQALAEDGAASLSREGTSARA